MKQRITFGRRDVMLAGLATGLASVMGLRTSHATVFPAGNTVDQTAALQAALDAAAHSGKPLFLPRGAYKTGRLILKSGTQLQGVPGRTVLVGSATMFEALGADGVRLSGLVLDGGGAAQDATSALLTATETTNLDVSGCRFLNSFGHGVSLRKASGRIAHCEFGSIAETALSSEDGNGIEISHNMVDTAATGIAITGLTGAGRHCAVHGNRIRNLFHRKIGACGGVGIGVDASCRVTGNIIERAPAYGILLREKDGPLDVDLTGNIIRQSHIGIGVPAGHKAGSTRIAENLIDVTKDGRIRAMIGPRPVGPDLADENRDAPRALAVYANVSR